jgi:hypothetical protein
MGKLLTDEVRKFIGTETELQNACDCVEAGAVRRYAQAVMDMDPIYSNDAGVADGTYGTPVAPPLFPMGMLRSGFDAPDILTERASDPAFDGLVTATFGLPPLPLKDSPLLNGGTEVEVYRFARHGEDVRVKSRYLAITERETSKGTMMFVVIETDYLDTSGQLISRSRRTQIRREGKSA